MPVLCPRYAGQNKVVGKLLPVLLGLSLLAARFDLPGKYVPSRAMADLTPCQF